MLRHGCLDNFSAFKFENYLGIIKKSISHSRFPLQEAANRIHEKCKILFNDHHDRNIHFAETHILTFKVDSHYK